MLNLMMAGCWILIGGLLLVWQGLHPENRALTILGTGISIGWLAFVLALYNLVRWWSGRSFVGYREALAKTRLGRPSAEERKPPATPDPNFNFTDERTPER